MQATKLSSVIHSSARPCSNPKLCKKNDLTYLYLAIVMYMEPCNFGSFRKMLLWRINMSNMNRLCTLSNLKVKLKVQLKGKVERLSFLARSRN